MDATLHKLGILLIQSIPTILFFILMAVFLNATFFRPMARVLEERRKSTEGVRELARQAMEAADKKGHEFEAALHLERMKMQEEHGRIRERWLREQQEEIAQARADAERHIEQARERISSQTERAQDQLDSEVQALSDRMVAALLRGKAA